MAPGASTDGLRETTSPEQQSLFEGAPASAPGALIQPKRATFPRHVWSNTTTRELIESALSRLTILVDAVLSVSGQEVDLHDLAETVMGSWSEREGGEVGPGTFRKVLHTARVFGLIDWPRSSRRGVVQAFPAGEGLLTDPTPKDFLAHLCLQLPASSQSTVRGHLAMLRFVAKCGERGLERVPVDHLAVYCVTVETESRWGSNVSSAVARERIGTAEYLRAAKGVGELRATIRANLDVLFSGRVVSASEAAEIVDAHRKDLLPGARDSRVHSVANDAGALAASGDLDAAAEVLVVSSLERTTASHIDSTRTAARQLVAVGLLDEGIHGFALTEFGAEALAAAPSKPLSSYGEALRALRSTCETPYAGRTARRVDRFVAFLEADRDPEGRLALAEAASWDAYAGLSEYATYEFIHLRATLSLLDKDRRIPAEDLLQTLRTRLGYNFEAIAAAPGGGPDGVVPLQDLDVVVEVSGNRGAALIRQELEPVTRHVRDHATATGRDTVGLLISPEFDEAMVLLMLAMAQADPSNRERPACPVIPLTDTQMAALLRVDADLEGLLLAARTRMMELSTAANWESSRELLGFVDQLVAERA